MDTACSATRVPATLGAPTRAAGKPCRSVLMVGTSPDVRGGVSSLVRSYYSGGLFERFDIRYVSTHRDGTAAQKAVAALKAYATLTGLLLTSDAPLVHIHLASRASFWRKAIVCAMAGLRRRPYVLHVHGAEFSKFYHEECGAFSKRIVRRVLERAASLLALSGQWQDELKRIAPRATVQTLPNAVALRDVPAPAADGAPLRILFAGRIGDRKGTFELLRAFARLAPKYPAATLVCAGDGEGEKLKQLAAELGVADRLECPGWLNAEQMAGELRRASVFALPSHHEGVPIALLEAMSHSLPVLTTPVGGIPEVVESDRNGILVSPGDLDAIEIALEKLIQSSDERERLGAAARATIAERYSLDSTIERLAALYRFFGVPERNA
jgi:glycosyltransferase involved in cell wall biosynthesis